MMTDELRIACERLLRDQRRTEWFKKHNKDINLSCPIEDPYPAGVWEPTKSVDHKLLAEAYLEEHFDDFI